MFYRYRRHLLAIALLLILSVFAVSPAGAFSPQLDLRELSTLSDLIAIGQVSQLWAEMDEQGVIHTHARVVVEQRLDARLHPKVVEVKVLGGVLGDVGLRVSGSPVLTEGETLLLFLTELEGGQYAPLGLQQGVYAIQDGVLVANGRDVAEVAQAITVLRGIERRGISLFSGLNLSMAPQVSGDRVGPSFIWQGHHWPSPDPMNALFYVNPNATSCTGEAAAVVAAAQTWSQVEGADFSFKYGGVTHRQGGSYDGWNVASWQSLGPYPQPLALAYTWYRLSDLAIMEADMVFNQSYVWSTANACPLGAFDVQNVATHELGHWVGLKDLYDPAFSEVTMYGYTNTGETKKRVLHLDDEEGLRTIYPARDSQNRVLVDAPWGQPDVWYRFQAEYRDASGWQNIKYADLLIGASPDAEQRLHLRYDAVHDLLFVYDPGSDSWQPLAGRPPGAASTIGNLMGQLDTGRTSVQAQGDALSISWQVRCTFRMSGLEHTLYTATEDVGGVQSGWLGHDPWVVNRRPSQRPPDLNNQLVPAGQTLVFQPTYGDPDGGQTLAATHYLIAAQEPQPGQPIGDAVHVKYDHVAGKMYLRDIADSAWLPAEGVTPRTPFQMENEYVIIRGSGSQVVYANHKEIKVLWVIEFKEAFRGLRQVYMRAVDDLGPAFGGDTGWVWQGWLEVN